MIWFGVEFLLGMALAQGMEPMHFELEPARPKALLGEPLEISGKARFPERYTLRGEFPGQDTGAFEILEVQLGNPASHNGFKSQTVRIRAQAFELGNQTFPALTWTLWSADASSKTLLSPPVRLEIEAPKPEPQDGADIRDIRGPLRPRIWPWLLAGIAAAALGALFWSLSRRKVGNASLVEKRPPHEIALEQLEALPGLHLPVKEFYDRLSDILRAYFERRFGLPALSMTTQGLQRIMIRSSIDPEVRAMSKTLLERCDLVKFARLLPAETETLRDCETAKEILRMTRPLPETSRVAGNVGGKPR